MSARGRAFLVTGIPGTGIKDALTQFREYASNAGHNVEIIDVEHYVVGDAASALKTAFDDFVPGKIANVVRLPRQAQRSVWRQGFRRAMGVAQQHLEDGRDVLVALHASWYLQVSRQFIGVVHPTELRDLEFGAVINLIDDVFDVAARDTGPERLLTPPRDVLKDPDHGPEDALIYWGHSLMELLHWRAIETAFSQMAAEAAGVDRFYVLAVKHPLRTLYDILYDDSKPVLYLSHPISVLRAVWNSDSTEEERDRAAPLLQHITELTRGLRNHFAVIEPTTIDELRFAGTSLGPRWPHSRSGDLLWTSPNTGLLEQWEKLPEFVGPELREKAGGVVDSVTEEIARQVNARDHQLVEQSDTLSLYRPYISGAMSKGMRAEIWHYSRLRRLQLRNAPAYGYHPEEDEPSRLSYCALMAAVQTLKLNEQQETTLRPLVTNMALQDWKTAGEDELQSRFRTIFDQGHILYRGEARSAKNPLAEGELARGDAVLAEVVSKFGELAEDAEVFRLEEEGSLVSKASYMAPEQFADWVATQYQSNQVPGTDEGVSSHASD